MMAATKTTRASQPSNPFIKQLASSNRTTRDRAFSSLRTYLSTQHSTPLSTLDLLKLWKGLFYCMFMSDKPRNQQALARDLAALVDVLPNRESKLSFMAAFWTTMGKEWGNIDYLRMDKYLYLVRCYIAKGFEVLAESGWDEEMVGQYIDILKGDGGPLSARDMKVPNGLRLHVLDVWVDELEKIDGETRQAPVEKVMEPVRKLMFEAFAKSVQNRARESFEDERLLGGVFWREDGDAEEAHDDDDDAESEQNIIQKTHSATSVAEDVGELESSSQIRRRHENK